jgi:hypothetical protein
MATLRRRFRRRLKSTIRRSQPGRRTSFFEAISNAERRLRLAEAQLARTARMCVSWPYLLTILSAGGGPRTHTPLAGPRILSRPRSIVDRDRWVQFGVFWLDFGDRQKDQYPQVPACGASYLSVACQYAVTATEPTRRSGVHRRDANRVDLARPVEQHLRANRHGFGGHDVSRRSASETISVRLPRTFTRSTLPALC